MWDSNQLINIDDRLFIPRHEGEMYKTLLSDYDTRQRELLSENAELNKVLQQMKKDIVSILSSRKLTLKGEKHQDDGTQVGQVVFLFSIIIIIIKSLYLAYIFSYSPALPVRCYWLGTTHSQPKGWIKNIQAEGRASIDKYTATHSLNKLFPFLPQYFSVVERFIKADCKVTD